MLEGKVVLVTGSARGVGSGIARQLVRRGATVCVNYAASELKANRLVDEFRAGGGHSACYQADVTDASQVSTMVDQIEHEWGRLDGVVNNAIAGLQEGNLSIVAWSDFETAFSFGCKAVVNTTMAALPAFARAGGGRIVNVVTDFWNEAPPGWAVYLAGKGALVGLSRSLSAELGPEGVTVNMVAPGWIVADSADEGSDESVEFASRLPLRRRAHGEDVGDVVSFYMSDLASQVTGAYLLVNGGRTAQVGT